jgi:hypothetical protein
MILMLFVCGLHSAATASSGFFTALSDAEISSIRSGARQRCEEFFTSQAGKPLNPSGIIVDWNGRGDFTRYWNQDIMTFAIRAFELNEMLDEANAAVQEMCQYHLDRPQTLLEVHSFPSVTDALTLACRFYGPNGTRAPGRLSSATYAKILETMWEWTRVKSTLIQTETAESQTWLIDSSENHHAQNWATCWGFSMILKDEPLYQNRTFDDGHTPQEHYAAWTAYLREYLFQRMTKGMLIEIDSPSYASATLRCVYFLYDFSDDTVLKERAGRFLTLYWALWAEQQIDGVQGGAKTRCYPDSALSGVDFVNRAAWYALNIGDPAFRHISMLQYVMTTWQIPDAVLNLFFAPAGRGVYEIRQRRMGLVDTGYTGSAAIQLRKDFGGILRYSYCTPDFIMSSLMTEAHPSSDWTTISSQNRWSGVIFRGHTNARIYPYLTESGSGSIYNGFWSAQSKGTLISQKLKTSIGAGQWRVWFSKSGLSTPIRAGDWFFAETTNAFAAVRVFDGGFSSLCETNAGRWIACSNQYSPVIIEVAQKSDFAGAEAFRSAVLALPISGSASNVFSYTGLSGDQFVFYTDQSRPPEINGVPVNYAPVKVYDSPYVQADFGAGVVSVEYGEKKTIIDAAPHVNDTNTVALWHFNEAQQDGAETYYADDTTGAQRTALHARENTQSTNCIYIIADGKFGNAVRCAELTGDQYMMNGSVLWPAGQGTFRYQGWFRLNSGDRGGHLFHIYDQVYLSVTATNATFAINKSGVATDSSATNLVSVSGAISTSNAWQYIEAVYDGSVIKMVTEKETVSMEGVGEFVPNTRNVYIGSRKSKSNFVGDMDEVKISTGTQPVTLNPLNVDGDGLPDSWEIARFGNRGASDGTGDADSDGCCDLVEYRAGTNPNDPGSLLKLNRIVPASGGEFTVHWQSVTGRNYRVLHTTNLVTGIWESRAFGIPGTALESSRTVTTAGVEGFFKIQTE